VTLMAHLPAKNDKEAEKRFLANAVTDPFPEIPSALLNTSDLFNYVCVAGMIDPFDEENLKTASYAISIGNNATYWDGNGTKREMHFSEGNTFTLPPNSIVFVDTKEKFRLPNYMALRFNLKIEHVHRGLLLGTGPIVDPGFTGRLLVPLHNLTTNEYELIAGDTFAWAEFTKISLHPKGNKKSKEVYKKYKLTEKKVEFPTRKKNRTESDYLSDARYGPIRSSIPDAMESAKKSAQEAKNFSAFISVAVVIAIATIIVSIGQLVMRQESELRSLGYKITDERENLINLRNEFDSRIRKIEEAVKNKENPIQRAK
jgi:deoxycytidine triphosphate deaminase